MAKDHKNYRITHLNWVLCSLHLTGDPVLDYWNFYNSLRCFMLKPVCKVSRRVENATLQWSIETFHLSSFLKEWEGRVIYAEKELSRTFGRMPAQMFKHLYSVRRRYHVRIYQGNIDTHASISYLQNPVFSFSRFPSTLFSTSLFNLLIWFGLYLSFLLRKYFFLVFFGLCRNYGPPSTLIWPYFRLSIQLYSPSVFTEFKCVYWYLNLRPDNLKITFTGFLT